MNGSIPRLRNGSIAKPNNGLFESFIRHFGRSCRRSFHIRFGCFVAESFIRDNGFRASSNCRRSSLFFVLLVVPEPGSKLWKNGTEQEEKKLRKAQLEELENRNKQRRRGRARSR